MTLAKYKMQAQEIAKILMNFSGKEEEAEGFAKTLMGKYREFGEFNAKALECKSLAEFKKLANENGMKFGSDAEANELFLCLIKGKKEVEKTMLSMDDLASVSGGASLWGRVKEIASIGFTAAAFVSGVVGMIAGAFNDDASISESLSYGAVSLILATIGGGLMGSDGTVLPGQPN